MPSKSAAAPKASRPRMQSYGVPASMTGAVPWAKAERQFADTHNYWVATVRPDGRPSSTAVWGVWLEGKFWFSCSLDSRKAKNLAWNPGCAITTDQAEEPVIMEGIAERVRGRAALLPMTRAYEKKYNWKMDPDGDGYFVVTPRVAFAFIEASGEFASSATRYEFDDAPPPDPKPAVRAPSPPAKKRPVANKRPAHKRPAAKKPASAKKRTAAKKRR
jgi:hypothetical protein